MANLTPLTLAVASAVLAVSEDPAVTALAMKKQTRRHVSQNPGTNSSAAAFWRTSFATPASATALVSSHCLPTVSREWCTNRVVGVPVVVVGVPVVVPVAPTVAPVNASPPTVPAAAPLPVPRSVPSESDSSSDASSMSPSMATSTFVSGTTRFAVSSMSRSSGKKMPTVASRNARPLSFPECDARTFARVFSALCRTSDLWSSDTTASAANAGNKKRSAKVALLKKVAFRASEKSRPKKSHAFQTAFTAPSDARVSCDWLAYAATNGTAASRAFIGSNACASAVLPLASPPFVRLTSDGKMSDTTTATADQPAATTLLLFFFPTFFFPRASPSSSSAAARSAWSAEPQP
mmetsp:Transcript_15806/g.51869  ORF Transcript_15806/g.51869 Transcript_15806/m.51869 type:complete len:350 (-) Transcript_15806:1538-2587(-)